MAKKLTQQTLERMVMQTMNESKEINEFLGAIKNWASGISQPASTLFGRKATLPKARSVAGRNTLTDIADFLEMLAYERDDLPEDVKEYAGELADAAQAQAKAEVEKLKTALGSTAQAGTSTDWDLEEIPDEETDTYPTSKEPEKKFAESKKIEAMVMEAIEEMNMSYVGSAGERRGTTPIGKRNFGQSKSAVPTTKATAKEKEIPPSPKAKEVGKSAPIKGSAGQEFLKRVQGKKSNVSESNFESLIADVLKEMAKKPVKK